ncbi:isoprenylcysteine carboxyl methyltransferase family protein [Pseudokineococcus lusitanus]|uniref:Alkylresorcinol O-methyltransferase n=1 Tax=Pseudokineococcus lusitanus TaxID=763993 RepID=A0A3N1HKQ9_9ACTN|nr:isoprenylcysteine carboxylmethyltransferase family protein [Pseudokineococcus lusitanus]ROP43055.1 alkylresorcinol O-methyltransferase [Pseudokineococcus lusitanus]
MSVALYAVVVVLVAVERLVELVISRRNLAWAMARGGVETGRRHFPVMVALHTALLVACLVEVVALDRPFVPWLGWTMLVVLLLTEATRAWVIATLGRQWNTRVVVVPGMRRVTRGPYRFLRHPNYVIVAAEGVALPLIHTAWVTALVFTVLNAALLLLWRIPAEERALARLRSA